MSNNPNKMSEREKSWTKFELESFEPHSLSRKEYKSEFVGLQIEVGEVADFTPLTESGDPRKRKDAEDILKQAQERAAALEREAYEKGFAQGEKDGFEFGEKKAIKVIENIEKLFTEISNLRREILKRHEKEIIEIAFAIAKKIINRQIALDEKTVRDSILKAIDLVTEKSKIIIRVNPEDFDYVEKIRPELFTRIKDLKSVIVTSEPSIGRGGCFLETPHGDVDAMVESQLDKIHQHLETAFIEESGLVDV